MAPDRFWELIDATTPHEGNEAAQLRALRSELSGLAPDEIIAFELAFEKEMDRAYTWDLWGAAYVLRGGASDDAFTYFRRWLISKGRDVFEATVQNPDDLADMLAPDIRGGATFESFAYVAGEVWSEKMGKDAFEEGSGYAFDGVLSPPPEPSGEQFVDDADHLSKRYPKLWKRFGENPLAY